MNAPAQRLTRKDFVTDQDVRWCPGCGDYAILAAVQKVFAELNLPREQFAIVSGIGCSSRFPYYMNTYGFHTIHGRPLAVATGLKAARPELSVWVVTGDGDALSIGGNHLIHTLRRNVDVKILLFNNQIYGLTKGQASPTSELHKATKSTPFGSTDIPFDPVALALGAGASFVARTIDRDPRHMTEMLHRVAAHRGTALLEIYQNCPIFNDGAFEAVSDRKQRDDRVLFLQEGAPLLYGQERDRAIVQNGFGLEVQAADTPGLAPVHHSETAPVSYATALADLQRSAPEMPIPMGVFRAVERNTWEEEVAGRKALAEARKRQDLQALLRGRNTWTVEEAAEG